MGLDFTGGWELRSPRPLPLPLRWQPLRYAWKSPCALPDALLFELGCLFCFVRISTKMMVTPNSRAVSSATAAVGEVALRANASVSGPKLSPLASRQGVEMAQVFHSCPHKPTTLVAAEMFPSAPFAPFLFRCVGIPLRSVALPTTLSRNVEGCLQVDTAK